MKILHVDMDAFFAAVEMRDDRSLRGRPVVVGGAGRRGVVASASYEARRFGVGSAMPVSEARRRCSSLVVVSPDFKRYRAASSAVMEIFGSFTPLVEQVALDEAFLDVSSTSRLFGAAAEIAAAIRSRILDETGLVASVGGASAKFIAKLASAKAKPDGVLLIDEAEVFEFLHPLAVDDLWGVGRVTRRVLGEMGIRTVGDIARTTSEALSARLGEAVGAHLHAMARGIDHRQVEASHPAKSISHEATFDFDLVTRDEVDHQIRSLSDRVGRRLRYRGLGGRVITLKVRLATMSTISRSRSLDRRVNTGHAISEVAVDLFDSIGRVDPRVRLLGVSVGRLEDAGGFSEEQLVFDAPAIDWFAIEDAADKIRERFGDESIRTSARPGGRHDQN